MAIPLGHDIKVCTWHGMPMNLKDLPIQAGSCRNHRSLAKPYLAKTGATSASGPSQVNLAGTKYIYVVSQHTITRGQRAAAWDRGCGAERGWFGTGCKVWGEKTMWMCPYLMQQPWDMEQCD